MCYRKRDGQRRTARDRSVFCRAAPFCPEPIGEDRSRRAVTPHAYRAVFGHMLRNTFACWSEACVFSVPSNSAPRLAAPEPCVALQERYPLRGSHGLGPTPNNEQKESRCGAAHAWIAAWATPREGQALQHGRSAKTFSWATARCDQSNDSRAQGSDPGRLQRLRRRRQRNGRIARIYVEISDGRQEDDGDALARNPASGRESRGNRTEDVSVA